MVDSPIFGPYQRATVEKQYTLNIVLLTVFG